MRAFFVALLIFIATIALANPPLRMRGPAAETVGRYLSSTRGDCPLNPDKHDCTLRSNAIDTSLFYGRFPDDKKYYAVAFVTFDTGGSGAGLSAFLFRSADGQAFYFFGAANNIYGADPRQVQFNRQKTITWIGTIARPGDAHCCPTGKKLMRLSVSDRGVVFDSRQ